MDPKEVLDRINSVLHQINDLKTVSNACSISFGILQEGQIVLTKCLGLRDVEHGLPANEDTMYLLASCSKMFLSALVSIVVNDGLLDWNAPLSAYLPEFNPCHDPAIGSKATIRDFLRHSSGICGGTLLLWGPDGDLVCPEQDFINLVNNLPTSDEDGQRFNRYWAYSNLGYGLVALALQRVYGRRYHTIVQDLILEPLGLHRTVAGNVEASHESNIAFPYVAMGDGSHCRVESDKWTRQDHTPATASMGLRSSVSDMLRWCREVLLAERREQLVGNTDKRDVNTDPLPGIGHTRRGHWTRPCSNQDSFDQGTVYGLGWWRTTTPTAMLGWTSCNDMTRRQKSEHVLDFVLGVESPGISVVAHNGVFPGSTSAVYTFPETNSAIVAFSTGASDIDVSDLCVQILMQALFDLEPKKDLVLLASKEGKLSVEEFEDWQASIREWKDSDQRRETELPLGEFIGTYSGHVHLQIYQNSQDIRQLCVRFGNDQNVDLPLNHRVGYTFSYLPAARDLYHKLSLKEWHRLDLFTLQFEVDEFGKVGGLWWLWDADESPSFFERIPRPSHSCSTMSIQERSVSTR